MINFPEHAPFSAEERKALGSIAAGWSVEQRLWLSNYLARGISSDVMLPALTVLYGTESGNSEELAERTVKLAKARGFKARSRNMAESTPAELSKVENLLVVVSTWGEGDPPETAEDYYQTFMAGGLELAGVRFSVCALGDTSYDQYCLIGKEFDEQLAKLGAERVAPRADCDVDFEELYVSWVTQALDSFGVVSVPAIAGLGSEVAAPAVEYGKKNPFPAKLLEKVLLSAPGSKKETWHFEFSLEGSGLSYDAGDSLAVVPTNAKKVVEALLKVVGLKGDEEVETKAAGKKTLRAALTANYDITALSRKAAKSWQAHSGSQELAELLSDDQKAQFKEWIYGRQIVDLLSEFPARETGAQELISMFRSLPPRLYSIASGPKAHEGEVHLTVAAVRYEGHGIERKGVASTCLADLIEVDDFVPVFVTPNKRFRPPEDDAAPIIMVGPGTGIAPFRAFVEERAAKGTSGKSWLVFGDQRYTYDFLYQLEWQDHLKSGALSHLDVAFSRDQPEKVYVQDRIREKAAEMWQWLEEGAHFYVCGDATRMAPDVHAALLEVIGSEGGRSAEEAESFLADMKKSGRYQRDVY